MPLLSYHPIYAVPLRKRPAAAPEYPPMIARWFILVLAAAFAELLILLRLADAFGWSKVVGWILLTGFAGLWLFRRGGARSFTRMNEELKAGSSRARDIVDSALLVFAGFLLLLPGVIADTIGLLLLIPPVRRRTAQRMIQRFRGQFTIFSAANRTDSFVDVDAVSSHDPAPRRVITHKILPGGD